MVVHFPVAAFSSTMGSRRSRHPFLPVAAPTPRSTRQILYKSLAPGLQPERARALIWTGGLGGSPMRVYSIAFYLAVVFPALAAAPGSAENASGAEQGGTGWAKVERLRSGQTIRVLCSDQRSWTGRLTGVSADELVLEVSGTERKAVRSEVLQVQVKSRARSALIGLGIGAGAGVGVGYAAGSGGGLKSSEVTTAVGLGAGLFAAAGAGVGSLFPCWRTVYRGESSPSQPPNALRPK